MAQSSPPVLPRFLVTGAQGCIGAWIVRQLVVEGHHVVAFDLDPTPRRLRLIATPDEISRVQFVAGDITDLDHLVRIMSAQQITHVIHLAALQVPACRADPVAGARVNVIGTLNVFEAAKQLSGQVQRIVYASSAAVFGPEERYTASPVPDDAPLYPATHYGVYKQCNEGSARIYWLEHGIPSVGLRPWTVYGVGRDQGLTSAPTKAILAAVTGRRYHIPFGGRTDMQYVADVAATFIAAATAPLDGAEVFNLRGEVVSISEIIEVIDEVVPGAAQLLTAGDQPIPIAPSLSGERLRRWLPDLQHTPLRRGVQETAERFRHLIRIGALEPEEILAA
ncbi:MAG: SDR family oxidoreductase [Anaerolineae bacterium]